MRVKIIADSVADIPKHLAEANDITVLPLTVNFEDGSYRDGEDLTTDQFFEKLKEVKKLPTTSQVTPGTFVETFETCMKEYDAIVCLTMSSSMSGTFGCACAARDIVDPQNIVVIDSKAVTFGYGMIAIEAAQMAKEGKSLEEIVERCDYMVKHVRYLFIVDTLDYLQKGGRLSASEAFVGSLLNIKPILTIEDGKLKTIDKVRGRKKSIKWVLDYVKSKQIDFSKIKLAAYHAVDEEFLDELINELREQQPLSEVVYSTVGAVVGTHSGPGCIAVSFIEN